MADTNIGSALSQYDRSWAGPQGPFSIDACKYAWIFTDACGDIQAHRTTNGGCCFTTTEIYTGTVATFDTWYDKQTPCDTGTKVHIILLDQTANEARYVAYCLCNGTAACAVAVRTGGIFGQSCGNKVSISKARGGQLGVALTSGAAASYLSFHTSANGVCWTQRGCDGDFAEIAADTYHLLPSLTSADPCDFLAAYVDESANALTIKKFDDSATSWSEAAIGCGFSIDQDFNFRQTGYAVDINNTRIMLAAVNDYGGACADLQTILISSDCSFTVKSNVVTNSAAVMFPSVFFDPANCRWLVTAIHCGTLHGTQKVSYWASTDDGTNWSCCPTTINECADDDFRAPSTGAVGTCGGVFAPAWVNDDVSNNIYVNLVKAVTLCAAAGGGSVFGGYDYLRANQFTFRKS